MNHTAVHRRLLDLPVRHGARERLLHLVRKAGGVCDRLWNPEDVEALHDFRVAIRRIRTFIRAYGEYVPVEKRLQRRLRDLGRRTNAPRDAEVGIEWLESQREHLTPRQRVGLQWLLSHFSQEKDAAYADVRGTITAEWTDVEGRLRKRLNSQFSDELGARTYAQVTGAIIAAHCDDFDRKLTHIGTMDDAEPAHEARIAAKRVRYLVEPLRRIVPGAKDAVKQLKAFQDTFGELNDTSVLLDRLREATQQAAAERAGRLYDVSLDPDADERTVRRVRAQDERSGLIAIASIIRERRYALYARIEDRYLTGSTDRMLSAIRSVSTTLETWGEASPIVKGVDMTGLKHPG